MNINQDALMFVASVIVVALTLGLIVDLGILIYWPTLKKKIFSPLGDEKRAWGLKDVFQFLLLYLFLQLLFALIFLLASRMNLFSESFIKYFALFWATLGVNLIVLGVLLSYLAKKYQIKWEELGLKTKNIFKQIGIGILSYIGFIPIFCLLIFISAFFCMVFGIDPKPHDLVKLFQEEKSKAVLISLILFASLVGPFIEEIFFRGFIYPAVKKKLGVQRGLLMTAAFFALVHFNFFQFIPILGLGLLLTYLYEKTGSLTASMTLHVLNNTVSVALTFYLLNALP